MNAAAATEAGALDPGRMVRASAVAEALGVNERTVREWERTKRIPSYRPTRRTVRYRLDEVLRAIRHAPAGEGNAP